MSAQILTLPWWKCEIPSCDGIFNTDYSRKCHKCSTSLRDMPRARAHFVINENEDGDQFSIS